MKKEKNVKSYTRKSKTGKTVSVKSYSASYEGAEEKAKKKSRKSKGAGCELASKKECGSDND